MHSILNLFLIHFITELASSCSKGEGEEAGGGAADEVGQASGGAEEAQVTSPPFSPDGPGFHLSPFSPGFHLISPLPRRGWKRFRCIVKFCKLGNLGKVNTQLLESQTCSFVLLVKGSTIPIMSN